ncbi:DUF3300 domain-containing protein [Microbacteriaceae bacterium K1510]|nr:DUF3300 domain-containing protein [Microbacteriaceae bacterium K1510]
MRFLLSLIVWLGVSGVALAQDQQQPQSQQQPQQQQQQETLRPEQLDQLVAPIALYPDALLANVLMASTYPLEVVEADRWAAENKNLKGEALKTAVDKKGWDDSVKQLTATPTVLNMMSMKLSWTQQLGDAVLAQQPDVMDAVQRLRAKAQANNKLESNKQQKVSVQTQANRQVIVIEPTDPEMIYVPYYDPAVVYGSWPYPDYPPYYFPPAPGWIAGGVLATGLAFGAGAAVGIWRANRGYWGGGFNWGNNNINIDRNVNRNWVHNPDHRQGVRYNNANVANRFNRGNDIRNGAQNRMDFRGRNGNQVLNPGAGNRPGAGGTGERRQAANRPANRPGAGGAGERRQAGNRPANRPSAGGGGQRRQTANRGGGQRPGGARPGGRDNAFSGISAGARNARAQSIRGHASMGGGGFRAAGGGGGFRGGGGGGFRGGGGGRGGGGRRSDIHVKHDIVRLGTLDNGLGFYRFAYNGSDKAYVGVIAQEVATVAPAAVTRDADGILRVRYEMLGVKFQTYTHWLATGARILSTVRTH